MDRFNHSITCRCLSKMSTTNYLEWNFKLSNWVATFTIWHLVSRRFLSLNIFETRMHSSRIRTARSSSRHPPSGADTSLSLPQTRHPLPQADNPPRAGTPPGQIPLNFPVGCVPGDPPRPDPPKLHPWVWAWKPAKHAGIPPPPDLLQGMLGYHLQCMLG